MKTIKYIFWVGLTFVLAVSLMAGACAPAAPEEVAEEIAELEADLAASEKKVKSLGDEVDDLEDEIAALKKPAEVYNWEPAAWAGAGVLWEDLLYMAEYIEKMSDGVMVWTPSQPGAVCPVDEQLDAVSLGMTDAMDIAFGYYGGKVPLFSCEAGHAIERVSDLKYLFETYNGGRGFDLFAEATADYGDAVFVGYHYMVGDTPMALSKPAYGAEDIAGLKFRSAGTTATTLASMGAGTVWAPGPEIYTMLATGVVDGATYSNAADYVAMSWHEVTTHWIAKPLAYGACELGIIVNGTVWRGMPDHLKTIVEAAIQAGNYRGVLASYVEIDKAWEFAEGYGIEIIEWSNEDCSKFAETARITLLTQDAASDPAYAEAIGMLEDFMVEMGRWK